MKSDRSALPAIIFWNNAAYTGVTVPSITHNLSRS
jgi:hypothetical protein